MQAQRKIRDDLTGRRFGRLTVSGVAGRSDGILWACECECGGKHQAKTGHLKAGAVQSCGCLVVDVAKENVKAANKKNTTHGMSHSRLDEIFKNMLARCYKPQNKRWDRYGGRGIKVCDQWRENRSAFFCWALANGYEASRSIDRIDVNGDYTPKNCRWATTRQQANNTSRSVHLTWHNETATVTEWAAKLGVRASALQHRVDRGWPEDRIFTQPFREDRT